MERGEARDGAARGTAASSEGLGADLSTLILPTNVGGKTFSPGSVFVIVDKADAIGN